MTLKFNLSEINDNLKEAQARAKVFYIKHNGNVITEARLAGRGRPPSGFEIVTLSEDKDENGNIVTQIRNKANEVIDLPHTEVEKLLQVQREALSNYYKSKAEEAARQPEQDYRNWQYRQDYYSQASDISNIIDNYIKNAFSVFVRNNRVQSQIDAYEADPVNNEMPDVPDDSDGNDLIIPLPSLPIELNSEEGIEQLVQRANTILAPFIARPDGREQVSRFLFEVTGRGDAAIATEGVTDEVDINEIKEEDGKRLRGLKDTVSNMGDPNEHSKAFQQSLSQRQNALSAGGDSTVLYDLMTRGVSSGENNAWARVQRGLAVVLERHLTGTAKYRFFNRFPNYLQPELVSVLGDAFSKSDQYTENKIVEFIAKYPQSKRLFDAALDKAIAEPDITTAKGLPDSDLSFDEGLNYLRPIDQYVAIKALGATKEIFRGRSLADDPNIGMEQSYATDAEGSQKQYSISDRLVGRGEKIEETVEAQSENKNTLLKNTIAFFDAFNQFNKDMQDYWTNKILKENIKSSTYNPLVRPMTLEAMRRVAERSILEKIQNGTQYTWKTDRTLRHGQVKFKDKTGEVVLELDDNKDNFFIPNLGKFTSNDSVANELRNIVKENQELKKIVENLKQQGKDENIHLYREAASIYNKFLIDTLVQRGYKVDENSRKYIIGDMGKNANDVYMAMKLTDSDVYTITEEQSDAEAIQKEAIEKYKNDLIEKWSSEGYTITPEVHDMLNWDFDPARIWGKVIGTLWQYYAKNAPKLISSGLVKYDETSQKLVGLDKIKHDIQSARHEINNYINKIDPSKRKYHQNQGNAKRVRFKEDMAHLSLPLYVHMSEKIRDPDFSHMAKAMMGMVPSRAAWMLEPIKLNSSDRVEWEVVETLPNGYNVIMPKKYLGSGDRNPVLSRLGATIVKTPNGEEKTRSELYYESIGKEFPAKYRYGLEDYGHIGNLPKEEVDNENKIIKRRHPSGSSSQRYAFNLNSITTKIG